jgi:N-acetylmuramoyl-L-alanine amidase
MCPSTPAKVAIDIGHSPAEPGALSASGKYEYFYNKRFVDELVRLNNDKKTLSLFVVNPDGTDLDLGERTQIASEHGADIFLSIHHDSANDKYLRYATEDGIKKVYTENIHGYSLFVFTKNKEYQQSLRLAELIAVNFRKSGLERTLHHAERLPRERRTLLNTELGIYDAPFGVLKGAMPSVLIELGVLPNKTEEQKLENPDYRTTQETAILDAIGAYCK